MSYQNTPSFAMTSLNFSSQFCSDLYTLARTHPSQNVVMEHDGRRMVIIQDIKDADVVMRKNADNYPKNLKWFTQVAGNSRLTEDGEQWKFRSALSQPFLGKYDHGRAYALSVHHASHVAHHLALQPQAQVLDEALIHQAMLSIFTQMFLEVELQSIPIAQDSASRLIELAAEYAFVAPHQEHTERSKEQIREILDLRKKVFGALQCLRADDLQRSPMLQKMLEAESVPGFDFAFEKEIVMLFGAGTDTSSYSIGWALHLLASYPGLQAQLHAGIHDLFQRYPDATERQHAIANHANLRCFIAELLRLYPPLPFVTRLARAPDRLSSVAVETGDVVIVSLVGVNYKALRRNDPWVPDLAAAAADGTGRGTGTHSSFIWGPRVCGGRSFALLELAAVLSVLIYRLRFELTSDEPVEYEWVGQMRRKGGHRVRALARPDTASV